jgi:DNA processing protein
MKLSDAQRLDWLRLIRSENIGPRTFRALVNRYGGAGPALEALPELAKRGGRTVTIATRDSVEREFEALTRFGAKVLCLGEDGFPGSLRAIDSPPPVLIVLGDLSVFARPAVAIVGSRNASAAGLAFAARMAGELARQDFVIASGLARGIDARAHHASLNSGTIAVLAGGLDRIYPAEHEKLARDICERGALVSEMPLGWDAPQPHRLRALAGHTGHRGGAPLGVTHHRAIRGRAGQGGIRRSRLATRSARGGRQRSSASGRDAVYAIIRCDRRACAAPAQRAAGARHAV